MNWILSSLVCPSPISGLLIKKKRVRFYAMGFASFCSSNAPFILHRVTKETTFRDLIQLRVVPCLNIMLCFVEMNVDQLPGLVAQEVLCD